MDCVRSRVLKHSALICLGVPARFLCRNALVHSDFLEVELQCGPHAAVELSLTPK